MSYQTTSILGILSRINLQPKDREKLVLPYIQRDYVWSENKMLSLLDSIARGYAIGTVLFWETKKELKYREFQKTLSSEIFFMTKDEGMPCTVVLDGQQRIQSLYFCCYGAINGKGVFLNLFSGYFNNNEDINISYSDEIFEFKFLSEDEAESINNKRKSLFVKLQNIIFSEIRDIENYKDDLNNKYKFSPDQRTSVSANISNIRETFNKNDYFSFYTIDKGLLADKSAKSMQEVLEMFVRVNSMGTPLSKSELMFSFIKSRWNEAFETFERITRKINETDKYDFDSDFLLKCLLTIHTKQSRFSIDKLNDDLIKIFTKKEHIDRFERSIEYLKMFITENCKLRCDAVFNKSYNTLIPILYYIYINRNNIIPESEERKVRYFLYASLFKKYISRYTDNRLPKLITVVFDQNLDKINYYFPLNELIEQVEGWEGNFDFNDDITLNSNIPLVMNIIYDGIILPPYQRTIHKDLDHIYPKSKLADIADEKINTYGNYRYINNIINKIKSDEEPLDYFKGLTDTILKKDHLINKSFLSKDSYNELILDRQILIKDKIKSFMKY